MLQIDLPNVYEEAIVDTQVVVQQRLTKMSVANATMIRQTTEVDKSEAMKTVNIINAEAASNATLIENNNKAMMTKNTLMTESKTYGEMKT